MAVPARRVVLVAAGEGVGYLSGTSYLASFASNALLHRVVLKVIVFFSPSSCWWWVTDEDTHNETVSLVQMGVVCDRLAPLYMEDEAGTSHFADAYALAAECPGLSVVSQSPGSVFSDAEFLISSDTAVELFAPQSSVVICVSMRGSSAMVDPYSGKVLLDRSQESVSAVIRSLNTPYNFAWEHINKGLVLQMTVHLTLVAEGGTGGMVFVVDVVAIVIVIVIVV
jgi:hypothetical protein